MKLQLNTDNNIHGSERLEARINEKAQQVLKHLTQHITRLEVHLSDLNAHKAGPDDIQCRIEARVEHFKPMIGTSKSDSIEKSVDDALDKIKANLTTTLGKLKDR